MTRQKSANGSKCPFILIGRNTYREEYSTGKSIPLSENLRNSRAMNFHISNADLKKKK